MFLKREKLFSSAFLIVGLLISGVAFFNSLWMAVGVFSEHDRVVLWLENDPEYRLARARLQLYEVLPLIVGLGFCGLAFFREKRITSTKLSLFLLAAGLFLVFYGSFYAQAAEREYSEAVAISLQYGVNDISDQLRVIYNAYGLMGYIWVVAGLFFIVISAYSLYLAAQE